MSNNETHTSHASRPKTIANEVQKRMFTEAEAAHFLNVSVNTLRQQRSDGSRKNRMPIVPYIQLGRLIRCKRQVNALL